jgi:dihydrofolate reductase
VAVVPIVAVHGAQVPWGKVVVDGVPVVSARRLPSMLRQLPVVLAPERVAALADQARIRFHPAAWSTSLQDYAVNEVSKLKQQLAGDIVVPASFQLVRPLIEHDLADELRLMIYPVVLGAGERLFGETSDNKPLRLISTRTVGSDLAYLTYQPVRDA